MKELLDIIDDVGYIRGPRHVDPEETSCWLDSLSTLQHDAQVP